MEALVKFRLLRRAEVRESRLAMVGYLKAWAVEKNGGVMVIEMNCDEEGEEAQGRWASRSDAAAHLPTCHVAAAAATTAAAAAAAAAGTGGSLAPEEEGAGVDAMVEVMETEGGD